MVSKHELIASTLADHLPGKMGNDVIEISVDAIKVMMTAVALKAEAQYQGEPERTINSFLGSLMGSCMALEAIADAADNLLQQDPGRGADMLAELVRSVQARLQCVTDEMELASKGRGQM